MWELNIILPSASSMKTGAVTAVQSWGIQHSNKSRHPPRLPLNPQTCIPIPHLSEGCQHFVCIVTTTTVTVGRLLLQYVTKNRLFIWSSSWDRMKEQMRDTDPYTNNWYRFHCQMAKYIIFTKVDSRQSHLMGKSDILEGISTDQLPMVVTMGSSAAGTRTENTEVLLSCVYRAHCANAFRISSSNSSSAIKSHALQAGITSLVVNYTELYSTAFVVWSCIIQWRWFVNTCVCTWRQR